MRYANILVVSVVVFLTIYPVWLWRGRNANVGDLTFADCALTRPSQAYSGSCEIGTDREGRRYPLNPMTTAIIAAPFLAWPDALAAIVFTATFTSLLAWGLIQTGDSWRLLVFASASYWLAVQWVQWSPLILASFYLAWLWPVALLAKPHVALPVALLRWQREPEGVLLLVAIGAGSLLFYPGWPLAFLSSIGGYSGGPALLTWYGPILLLALARLPAEPAKIFLLAAVVPLRGLYDLLILFAIAQNRTDMVLLVAASWVAVLLNGPNMDGPGTAFFWFAGLGIVLWPEVAFLWKKAGIAWNQT